MVNFILIFQNGFNKHNKLEKFSKRLFVFSMLRIKNKISSCTRNGISVNILFNVLRD